MSGNPGVRIIVNADDAGVAELFTDASISAVERGAVSSLSVITPGHDADRALAILARRPEIPVGVHLALTGDWKPLISRDDALTLYSDEGTMFRTSEDAGARVLPEHAKREWRAQVQKAVDAGVRVTHIDGHMGCYFQNAGLFLAAWQVSTEFGIPLIVPPIPPYMAAAGRDVSTVVDYVGVYAIPGKAETLDNRADAYRTLLAGMRPGLTYVFSHHGWAVPNASDYGDLAIRIDDYDFWTGPKSRALLDELRVTKVGPDKLLPSR